MESKELLANVPLEKSVTRELFTNMAIVTNGENMAYALAKAELLDATASKCKTCPNATIVTQNDPMLDKRRYRLYCSKSRCSAFQCPDGTSYVRGEGDVFREVRLAPPTILSALDPALSASRNSPLKDLVFTKVDASEKAAYDYVSDDSWARLAKEWAKTHPDVLSGGFKTIDKAVIAAKPENKDKPTTVEGDVW